MRILHILPSRNYSGAENVVCQIINMFRNDAEIEMIYCSPDGPVREALESRDIPYIALEAVSVSSIRKIIRHVKPDLVHAHDMKASVLTSAAVGRIPFVSHIHNNNFDSRKPTLKAILYRIAAARARHIFWVSQSALKGYYFHRSLEKKSTVLYNVIDIEQLREKAKMAECQKTYDIVYIGRLTYQKNPQRLLDVLELVVRQKPDVQAAIIGSGELEDEVKTLVVGKNLQDNVHCLGFMSNPYGILRNAKVMLMTSRWEGTPMCALEAMALGIPVVNTPTDGLCELVADGQTGYLGDTDKKLAQACLDIILDEKKQAVLSTNTRIRAEEMMDTAYYRTKLLKVYLSF